MSVGLPSGLLFEKPLVPTPISRRSPPVTSPKYLHDLPPLFPDEHSWRSKPELRLNIVRGVAFFNSWEHCIGASKTYQRPRVDHRGLLKKLELLMEQSGNDHKSRELLTDACKDIRRLADNRPQKLRFRRPIHSDPIFQRVAGTISKDGSAKLLVVRYHDQCLTPSQFNLLCEKELFGKNRNLGKDFPEKIQYTVFDLDNPGVREALEKHLFCNDSRHNPHIKKFEPFFWPKEKRSTIIGERSKKNRGHNSE